MSWHIRARFNFAKARISHLRISNTLNPVALDNSSRLNLRAGFSASSRPKRPSISAGGIVRGLDKFAGIDACGAHVEKVAVRIDEVFKRTVSAVG